MDKFTGEEILATIREHDMVTIDQILFLEQKEVFLEQGVHFKPVVEGHSKEKSERMQTHTRWIVLILRKENSLFLQGGIIAFVSRLLLVYSIVKP